MMHSIEELYKIKGDVTHIYSAKAVQFINHAKGHKAQIGDCYPMSWKTNSGKPFRIYHAVGSKEYTLGYLYGEKTWFDTLEELNAHRENQKIENRERKFQRIEELKAEIAKLEQELGL